MKKLTFFFWAVLCLNGSIAQTNDTLAYEEPTEAEIIAYYAMMDSIEQTFTYQYGSIPLSKNGVELALLKVPEGYKYLDPEQTEHVLTELWGNPSTGEPNMGMLFPDSMSPVSFNLTYGVEIDYSDEGYIEDSEAKNLDYTNLLTEMQKDTREASRNRMSQGYEAIELVGWAAEPFYDAQNKKLHWAKELKFGKASAEKGINTLNYNIRILGRGGYLNLNAIGDMDVLPIVQNDVAAILASVDFIDGQKYADFNPSMDKVAAYGVGGLIAGKVLAKVGFFAVLIKFWKFIALGCFGAFVAIKRFFFGDKTA